MFQGLPSLSFYYNLGIKRPSCNAVLIDYLVQFCGVYNCSCTVQSLLAQKLVSTISCLVKIELGRNREPSGTRNVMQIYSLLYETIKNKHEHLNPIDFPLFLMLYRSFTNKKYQKL